MASDSNKFKFTGGLALDPHQKCDTKLEAGDASFVKEEPDYSADEDEKKIIYKQAVPSVNKKLRSKRNRCGECGHNRYTPRGWVLAPGKRRTVHCSLCGQAGHNRRTCYKRH